MHDGLNIFFLIYETATSSSVHYNWGILPVSFLIDGMICFDLRDRNKRVRDWGPHM